MLSRSCPQAPPLPCTGWVCPTATGYIQHGKAQHRTAWRPWWACGACPGYTCCGSWAPEHATDSWSRSVKCTDFLCLPSIHVPRYGTEGFFRFYEPFSIFTLCEQCPQKYPSTLDVSDFIPFSLSVCQVMRKIWPWMMTELLSLLSIYFKVWVTDGRNKEAQADTNDN